MGKVLIDKRQTEDDKEDANPFDGAPKTEAEAIHAMKVEAALSGIASALARNRRWVTLQQFADMVEPVPVLEVEVPEIDGEVPGLYLFSVSGYVGAEKYDRVLLGGGGWMVSADNKENAHRLAEEGVRSAQEAANTYAFAEAMGMEPGAENPVDGVGIETAYPARH